MKITSLLNSGLLLAMVMVFDGAINASQAAPPALYKSQSRPPILIMDDQFDANNWLVTAETTGGATYTVTQQLSGGYANSPFRFISHRVPPVASGLATIVVTHLYLGASYDPSVQGAISAIKYAEAGIILSFPFPEAFSTTQPVVVQGGPVYRSPKFLRFIAENSGHAWEIKSLPQLTAFDFMEVGGSENDHPDFSTSGEPIQFGFARTNSRSSTQPSIPSDQDMVVDQGVDQWSLTIYRMPDVQENQPPQALDDIFVFDGYNRSLPFFEIFDVVRNDSDPDEDYLEVINISAPLYGSAGALTDHTVVYQLGEVRTSDSFSYTIIDSEYTSTAEVAIYVDCVCTVTCLNNLELPEKSGGDATVNISDGVDLPLIYGVRDQILKRTSDGRRYVEMYYSQNPEILAKIMMHESLRSEAVATVELWQESLRSLVDGDGSTLITQAEVDALSSLLANLSAVATLELQELITAELARLGPLDDYVGLSVKEAKSRAIGDPILYLPGIRLRQ